MLVIGCGNRERGDDGVGVLVAQSLRRQGMNALVYEGDPLGLLDLWSVADEVLLVDAVVTGAPAGTVHLWSAGEPWLAEATPVSSHGFDLTQALKLAKTLHRLPANIRICGIEGVEFAPGAPMSSPVQRSAEAVVSWLLSPLDSHGHSLQSERGNIAEHAREGPYLPNASGTSK